MATTTVRDLRNHFPRVKEMIEADGEVIVTDNGKPRYRLTLYSPSAPEQVIPKKDYVARLRRHQPAAIRAAAAKSLQDRNRGNR
jgi:antitoxin (DNA-binding transcriptional repressor) of toxin-antitoxin stability system